MPESSASTRDAITLAFAALLAVALLAGVREVLSPPAVLGLLYLALWPVRQRAGIRMVLVASTLLALLWFWDHYGAFLGPFVLAMVLAYLIAPAVARVEEWGVGRRTAIAIVLVPLVGILVGLIVLAAPQVADQASAIVVKAPQLVTTMLGWLDGIRQDLARWTLLSEGQRAWLAGLNAEQLTTMFQEHAGGALQALGTWALGLGRQIGTIFGIIGYLVITPVVLFHILRSWGHIGTVLDAAVPAREREGLRTFVAAYERSLGRYVRGAVTEALIIGVVTLAGLLIAGVPSALLLAVITGVSTLVPYLGVVVAATFSLVVALSMDDPASGLLRVAVVFAVVHVLDGSILGPRVVGNSVGIHPVWIMITLALSGAFFGVLGLFIAVPLAVLVKMLGTATLARYRAGSASGAAA